MGKSSDRCEYRTEPKYHKPSRKSPPYSAVPCEGMVMYGNDGKLWISERRGTSKTPRWWLVDSLKSTPRKKTYRAKKSRKKPTQTYRSKHKRKSQQEKYFKMLRKLRRKSRGRKSRGRKSRVVNHVVVNHVVVNHVVVNHANLAQSVVNHVVVNHVEQNQMNKNVTS